MADGASSSASIVLVVASNDESILRRNLLASPMVAEGRVQVHVERDAPSASIAYNRGLDATSGEIVLFAHHDVYFPRHSEGWLRRQIARLDALDPAWAVAGPYGVGTNGTRQGICWSTSIAQLIGRIAPNPEPVQSLDEYLLILRRASGLRFDDALPSWHLYGTDIVQAARAAGMGAYAINLPLVHNDAFKPNLGPDFDAPFSHVRRKWRAALPIQTPVVKVSWHGLHLWRTRDRLRRSMAIRRARAFDHRGDPVVYAELCGWEAPSPGRAAP